MLHGWVKSNTEHSIAKKDTWVEGHGETAKLDKLNHLSWASWIFLYDSILFSEGASQKAQLCGI